MALRSEPGILGVVKLGAQKTLADPEALGDGEVVIQISMPNRATSVSQSSSFSR